MSVIPLDLEINAARIPRHIEVLLQETSEAMACWEGDRQNHSFVPADYILVYDALCELRPRMPAKPRFLEWGSGLGIVTMLASALGWQAEGIEIQPGLVAESQYYAKIFDLPICIRQGSFFPEDHNVIEHLAEICGKSDLIYVYPWPDQEIKIFDLFNRLAKLGCLLLAYYGIEDIRVFQKD